MDTLYETKQLFGGAIQAELPKTASDLSRVVPVPDNQEVFTETICDASMILELLESVSSEDQTAINTIFEDLASANEANTPELNSIDSVVPLTQEEVPNISSEHTKFLLRGKQFIQPQRGAQREQVVILLGLVRLAGVSTDLVFTINLPKKARSQEEMQRAQETMEKALFQFLRTLRINDTSLFG